jgi:2-polyprenyl-3-methyl-5-hydroxy-6-metoxy-1,4-benzoquinol methylase
MMMPEENRQTRDAFLARANSLYRMDRGDRIYVKRHLQRWLDVAGIIRKIQLKKPHLKVLDVGCGSGFFMIMLGEIVTGLDKEDNVKVCKKRGVSSVFSVDIEKEPFPFNDESFDVVTFLEVLEHLKYPKQTLSEIFRVLKPKGVIILSTPNGDMPTWKIRDFALKFRFVGKVYMNRDLGGDEKQYTKNELHEMLISQGFKMPITYSSKILLPSDDLLITARKL